MNRFMLRKEYFGGLVYDRRTRREILLDPEQYGFLKSRVNSDLNSEKLASSERQFIEVLRKNQIITGNRFEADSVEVVLKDGTVSAPLRLYYHITFGCNLKCKHCMFGNKKRSDDELTTEESMGLINQLETIGCPELRITGGEPTIRPDLFEIINAGARRNMNVVVNTNGVFGDKIRESFVTSGIDGLVVSVDGDRKVHDKIRRKGSFDITMDTIRYITEHNRTAGRIITVCLNPTISKENAHLAEFLVHKAIDIGGAKLGVEINFMPLRPFGKATNLLSQMLDAEGWLKFTREIARLRNDPRVKEDGIRLYSRNMDLFGCYEDCHSRPVPFDRSDCGAATFRMGLSPNGQGNICGFIGTAKEFAAPTIREMSLLDVWHSKPFESFRNIIKEPCVACRFYRKECVGICKSMSYILTGEFGKRDHYCFVHLLKDSNCLR